MASNLRSAPIDGYITDGAGNILRNAEVSVKEVTPLGTNLIETTKSNDSGKFVTAPIKNGVYSIFESGTEVAKQYNSVLPYCIQVYAANPDNLPAADTIIPFATFLDPDEDINLFRHYIQIEPQSVDVFSYGNRFPIWDKAISTWYDRHPFINIATYHEGFTDDSRITHSRFDIEMFVPLVNGASHHRVRFAGVPAIKFRSDGRLVLPIDYLSIVPNRPWKQGTVSMYTADIHHKVINSACIELTENDIGSAGMALGDIMRVQFIQPGSVIKFFWGIVIEIAEQSVMLCRWRSANASQNVSEAGDIAAYDPIVSGPSTSCVTGYVVFQGIPSQIANIVQSVGERYTVTENQTAQNMFQTLDTSGDDVLTEEMYSYPSIGGGES
jgi:hypothetical protein